MFQWPKFAELRSPEHREGLLGLLRDLAEPRPLPSPAEVLASLFDDAALVEALSANLGRLDHVGFVAPGGMGANELSELLPGTPFGGGIRRFESAVWAKELSAEFGRPIRASVVRGALFGEYGKCPAVEIFVPNVDRTTLESLLAREAGCHVALALAAGSSFEPVYGLLHAHGQAEIPLMRSGPVVNANLGSEVLYVDVATAERSRRLEIIRHGS